MPPWWRATNPDKGCGPDVHRSPRLPRRTTRAPPAPPRRDLTGRRALPQPRGRPATPLQPAPLPRGPSPTSSPAADPSATPVTPRRCPGTGTCGHHLQTGERTAGVDGALGHARCAHGDDGIRADLATPAPRSAPPSGRGQPEADRGHRRPAARGGAGRHRGVGGRGDVPGPEEELRVRRHRRVGHQREAARRRRPRRSWPPTRSPSPRATASAATAGCRCRSATPTTTGGSRSRSGSARRTRSSPRRRWPAACWPRTGLA